MPSPPDEEVRRAALIARTFADQMHRLQGPDDARDFERVADEAETRADRLPALARWHDGR